MMSRVVCWPTQLRCPRPPPCRASPFGPRCGHPAIRGNQSIKLRLAPKRNRKWEVSRTRAQASQVHLPPARRPAGAVLRRRAMGPGSKCYGRKPGGGGGAAPQARQCNDAGSHEVVVQRRSTQTRRIEGATHCTQHRSRQHEEPAEVCKWLHSSMGAPLHRKQRPTGRPNLEPGIGCLRRRRLGNCNIEHGHALDNERNRTQCAHDAHGWAYNMLYAYCIHLPCVGYVYE